MSDILIFLFGAIVGVITSAIAIISIEEAGTSTSCKHGFLDWDECPVCRH